MRAQEPVGCRQLDCKGKQWPPYPRPVGPEAPWAHIYHAEHYWPWPYICTDRQVVLDMSRVQEANGWLCETTLYDYHFNPESNELTVPGKLQLKWILENVPPSYRAVWVQQAEDPKVSQQRLTNVRTVASRLMSQNNLPTIAFRPATAPGRPAIEVDSIRRKELETIPSPRIAFEAALAGPAAPAAEAVAPAAERTNTDHRVTFKDQIPTRTPFVAPIPFRGPLCRRPVGESGNAFS